jgi:hypothetical protein
MQALERWSIDEIAENPMVKDMLAVIAGTLALLANDGNGVAAERLQKLSCSHIRASARQGAWHQDGSCWHQEWRGLTI